MGNRRQLCRLWLRTGVTPPSTGVSATDHGLGERDRHFPHLPSRPTVAFVQTRVTQFPPSIACPRMFGRYDCQRVTYRRVAALPVNRRANGAVVRRQLGSHDHELSVWVETPHVVGVTRCDPVIARSGAKHHRGVDHVAAPGDTEELPRGTSLTIVQTDDVTGIRSKEPGKRGLAPPVSPHLADDAGGDAQLFAALSCTCDERYRPPLAALERDQRSGVEGDPYRHPASRSIRSRSESVRGPPLSSSNSLRSASRSSSLICSSSAWAT